MMRTVPTNHGERNYTAFDPVNNNTLNQTKKLMSTFFLL